MKWMSLIAGFAAVLALLLAMPTMSVAAEKTTAQVGEMAPDFELPVVGSDERIKLSDFRGEKIVVFTFQSTQCPWNYMRENAGYERVLYPMAQEYAQKDVVFLALNPNNNESVESLESYIQKHQMPYPLLKDQDHKVADLYGAKTTPHFFVIDKEGVLRYKGGFEAVPGNPEQAGHMEEQYLRPVLDALINGSDLPYTETVSKGCAIKR